MEITIYKDDAYYTQNIAQLKLLFKYHVESTRKKDQEEIHHIPTVVILRGGRKE